MAQSIQLGCMMVIGVILMAVAMALSIDGNTWGAVLVMLMAVVTFIVAVIRDHLGI